MAWKDNRALTDKEAELSSLRFCYKCAKRQPVEGGRMVRLHTGRKVFACAYHQTKPRVALLSPKGSS